MKRVYFAVITLLVLLLASLGSELLLKSYAETVTTDARELNDLCARGKWDEANDKANKSKDEWHNLKKVLSLFVYDKAMEHMDFVWNDVVYACQARDLLYLNYQTEIMTDRIDGLVSSHMPVWYNVI